MLALRWIRVDVVGKPMQIRPCRHRLRSGARYEPPVTPRQENVAGRWLCHSRPSKPSRPTARRKTRCGTGTGSAGPMNPVLETRTGTELDRRQRPARIPERGEGGHKSATSIALK